ncbi:hypothetical protein JCGZ_12678 [Jatropha curcas]|uniref:Uncharacterized protein n=1 Tax=Jatropha curcas TaxID=180498 RepID=A0A067KR84_JATCU|nr:hypothetical protein JCGZ_12677 [Jatropha curcas]KDP34330.1 hypothetical protein JCGZ_12678 [Jatropha curcas]
MILPLGASPETHRSIVRLEPPLPSIVAGKLWLLKIERSSHHLARFSVRSPFLASPTLQLLPESRASRGLDVEQRLKAGGAATIHSNGNKGREELRRDGRENAAQRTPLHSSPVIGKQEKEGEEEVGDGLGPRKKKERKKKRIEKIWASRLFRFNSNRFGPT